ncbi:MAG: glycoside hydrolase/phage tail family protein [Ahrensia sp.]|nr:glycoside hydrolase/phage tail family protein [Ahrensia sp.]
MATIILQTVGTALGGALGGPVGAAVGRAAGAIAGSFIDQSLFGPEDRAVAGPRLESAQLLSSREGTAIPRIFGQARVSGEIIWATRFEEVQSTQTQTQGGKGGGGGQSTTVTSYAYYGNFAIALCEGEIACIRRIWVDGHILDQRKHTIRLHRGTATQQPDSLIEAKQGAGNAPAYRGLAYLVFEHFALEAYGNRIPQIAVEIVRSVGRLEQDIRAVNMIPAATEFGYDTQPVADRIEGVETRRLNVSQSWAQTDFLASLDELRAICPGLRQISLVVSWFGNDLRAGQCELYPAVETSSRTISDGEDWSVAGLSRGEARLISQLSGSPNFGGTPSDNAVRRAIAAIKARGLDVCIHPFILMDVPPGNGRVDPYGQAQQPHFPWRGRITCDPAPGHAGSPDGSQTASDQIDAFLGDVEPWQIQVQGDTIAHEGGLPWSFRRMILHYARLAQSAGGVDMFMIGSEMRGVSTVRGPGGTFPFVDGLSRLADDVRTMLGNDCLITYGADWSEYFGYHPTDGSGNVYYHLDKLWSRASIDAVGIDNYLPISDWRGDATTGDEGRSSRDPVMLAANIARGEGYDWYYASQSHREAGQRTPITDGLGKPWVFRNKDLISWWSNPHFDRINGAEVSQAGPWVPMSKPIIFTESGCPAIDKGANQPNVFFDAKSSESAVPHFSDGGRDDAVMMEYIAAHQAHWDGAHPQFDAANNPVSPLYGGRMVDKNRNALWAWDARPYPAFPDNSEQWSDAENWNKGHWLNGRLGSLRLRDLIATLLEESGVETFDVTQVTDVFTGYAIAEVASARDALEVIISLFRLSVYEDRGSLIFKSAGIDPAIRIKRTDIALLRDEPAINRGRAQLEDLPHRVSLHHSNPANAYQDAQTDAQRINGHSRQQAQFTAPLVVEPYQAQPLLDSWLRDVWAARETLSIALPPSYRDLVVGDEVVIEGLEEPIPSFEMRWQIRKVEEDDAVRLTLRASEQAPSGSATGVFERQERSGDAQASAPLATFLDLPALGSVTGDRSNMVAATARPWPGPMAVFASASQENYAPRQTLENAATIGSLDSALQPSFVTSRWSLAQDVTVRMLVGQLATIDPINVLGGSNALAIEADAGGWEIVQFADAQLVATKSWRLTRLLRGQAGTEVEAAAGASVGARVVLLDTAVRPMEITPAERGLALNWLIGPAGSELAGPEFSRATFAPGYRGLQPFRPAHLRAVQRFNGDVDISWVRRDRGAADDWAVVDIPMSETAESYALTIARSGAQSLQITTASASHTVSSAQLNAAFGAAGQTLTISVSQIGASTGAGPVAQIFLPYNTS